MSPPLGWYHLKSSSSPGGQGPTAPSVERTWGWHWSDLIKAVTAHQVVTRSWGQPEKVVTYHFPHLTYRRVPVWRVVSVTAGRNCTIPLRAPIALTALGAATLPWGTNEGFSAAPEAWAWLWGGQGHWRKTLATQPYRPISAWPGQTLRRGRGTPQKSIITDRPTCDRLDIADYGGAAVEGHQARESRARLREPAGEKNAIASCGWPFGSS